MHIYKLKYKDKAEAITDLQSKNLIDENEKYKVNTQAVVYLGELIDTPATFDSEGNVASEATYLDGYHVDVMLTNPVNFESEIQTNKPRHKFL